MVTRQKTDHRFLRTKENIVIDYVNALCDQGVITSDQATTLKHPDQHTMVLQKLLKKLYETEQRDGQIRSTLDAFYHFCEFIICRDIVTGRKVWNTFVKDMFKIIEGHKLSAMMAPRGHGKSFMVFGLYIPFKAFLVPYFESIIVCNIPSMGKRNMRVMKRIIDTNELLLEKKATWKGQNLKWSESMIEYNDGTIEVTSIGSTVKSAHPNLCIADDPLREDNKYSDEHVENFILGTMLPIIQRKKGRMVILGTPQNERDLFHQIMNTKDDFQGELITEGRISHKGFYSRVFKAITDWAMKESLLPEILSFADLMEIRKTQGPRFFDREYMCSARSDEEAIFPFSILKRRINEDTPYIEDGIPGETYVVGVDVATSGAASADYTAMVVLGVQYNPETDGHKKCVRYLFYGKGIDFDEQIFLAQDISRRFNNAFVMVEKNNAGVAMINALERRNVNVGEIHTDQYVKRELIRYLKRELSVGNLTFCESVEPIRYLINELRNFGVRSTRGVERMEALTGKDDCAIALAIANWAAQDYGEGAVPIAID